MPDREKVIVEIEDALSGNLAKAGHIYKLSLNGLKDKALIDALALLKEQEHKDRMYHALEDDWKRLKELLKEQEAIIEQYRKADGFLAVHGWKWEGR